MSQRVPTNVITGFLGVGKTTTILNLLKNKPENEKWAVLVNEFGEIGIDGAIMAEQGAMIKEVPGGCMCCTAGAPMSVGVTALLRQKPDRLLIEPTGLGHPKEVIATLLSAQYEPYVDLKSTITLVDPRHLSIEKYTSNNNFNDQLETGDVIIGSKVDLATSHDIDVFNDWVTDQQPAKVFSKLIHNGELPLEVLDIERVHQVNYEEHHHHHHHGMEPHVLELPPEQTFARKENKGQGYHSCGWLFAHHIRFEFDEIASMLRALTAERVKAVINTDQGCYAFNVSNGVVTINELSLEGYESRVEVIDTQLMPWDQLESVLLKLAGIQQ